MNSNGKYSIFYRATLLLSAVYAVVVCLCVCLCACVCLSVCHTPVLYQNEHDSPMTLVF